jgi:hypothetical protein
VRAVIGRGGAEVHCVRQHVGRPSTVGAGCEARRRRRDADGTLEVTGFDQGIVVGTSDRPAPSGCNARITRSLIAARSMGVFVVGAGYDLGSNAPNEVSAEIGGETAADGNRFIGNHDADATGSDFFHRATAVQIFDNSSPVVIRHNTFSDNDIGVALGNHGTAGLVVVDDNYFTNMSVNAVRLSGGAQLHSLANNFFTGTTAPAGNREPTCGEKPTRGVALCVNGFPADRPVGPQIDSARGNVFAGNEVGVYVTGIPFRGPEGRRFDFGTEADPGRNTFVCNSSVHDGAGHDVWLDTGLASGQVRFVGNRWDHDAPTRGGAHAPDGTDLVVRPGGPMVDAAGSSNHRTACPEPHHP